MSRKHILVTGSTGQLGRSLQMIAGQYPEFEFHFFNRSRLDLATPGVVHACLEDHAFDYLINCAAYTAVDRAETEPELAEQINHHAVAALAEAARKKGTCLIHISTDYVFDGCHYKPYAEDHPTAPINQYGQTKLHGEQAIQRSGVDACIVRTSWVYSEFGNNFVKTMLRLGQERERLTVINDQVGTPTYAGDLATAIMALVRRRESQPVESGCKVFHYSNEGVCSWYDFALEIFDMQPLQCRVDPIDTVNYPTPARRPYYSVLNKNAFRDYTGVDVPHWKHSLNICLSRLKDAAKNG
ncbi:dTDP-4-dehydrorhamnose reductase [Pseudomonas saliphila]|uniref:dTDP-4-dehydrorhamnose reductase n=1 Tax=Pseudomonas saliphila TaxID=2586906 RepID=UPI00123B15EE|nr:dTDP-4-dehydrorhamnose reductase [Pseudomonas saliphila]